jgi:hypothetical protein
MRPYLAVLKDSFREALASRVLWILLIVITLILIAAAPLGFKEIKATQLKRKNVRDWPTLAAKIEEQGQANGPSPGRQIWSRISDRLKKALADSAVQSPGELSGELVDQFIDELNRMIGDSKLYEAAAWEHIRVGKEAQGLLERGPPRTGDETARLNRLLIEAAFKSEFRKGESNETALVYAWKESDPLPFSHEQTTQVVKLFLTQIVNWAVGVFGVFAAILVTASIIPQMFEAGAIDLLLSKPVSRTLLFLTKFLGGCAFIGLNATYFIAGLWLIAGSRFGIWNAKLWLCIPIILFLFAVYYGVSALAAVLWRNAIVSIVLTILFWGVSFGLWAAKGYIEANSINPNRLVKLVPAGKTLLAVNEMGQVQEWSPRSSTWEDVFTTDERPRFARILDPRPLDGPVFDAGRDRIVATQAAPPTGGLNIFTPPPTLLIGRHAGAFNGIKAGTAPPGTFALFASPAGDVVAISKGAVFRLVSERSKKPKSKDPTEKFVRIGPEPALRLDSSAAAAMNSDTGAIAIFNRGTVVMLTTDESGKYVRKNQAELADVKDTASAIVAFGGKTIVVAIDDGQVLLLDADNLAVKQRLSPAGDTPPRFAAASPGGRWFSVLFHNHKLWMFDAQQDREVRLSLSSQAGISGVTFNGPNSLLVADRANRVTNYDLDPFRAAEVRAPALDNWETAYYFGLVPLYTVLPKPGELGNVVEYLLTDQSTATGGFGSRNLSDKPKNVDIAGPIWSSLAFLVVVLGVACLYVRQADF